MTGILNDKVAVITGGSRGLGLGIAQAFAREGAKVVIASRSQAGVEAALETLRASGAQASGLACDVAELAQVEALAEYAISVFGRIDIWVNNAGISSPYGPTAHIPSSQVQMVINTNITGTYNGSVTALRKMVPQGSGKIVNLLGRGDKGPVALQNAYSASKGWIRSFTAALAQEYKDSGVEIFGFNPGLVRTELLSQVTAVKGFENKLAPLSFIAAMWGNEVEVPAKKAAWLVSAATDGKTGLMVNVLTSGQMFKGLFTVGLPRLLGRPVKLFELNIQSVEPQIQPAPLPVTNKE